MLVVVHGPAHRNTTPVRANAKTWGNRFEARFLEPGIVSYEDVGCGKAFLTKEGIERSMASFIGKPLILTRNLKHAKVTPKDIDGENDNKRARGYIHDVYWNPSDGWFWCRGIVHDDEAKDAITKVGLCSCGYNVTKVGDGGEYHAIPYDEEIIEFSGEHLAIVDKPRYEGATIRLNAKTKTDTTMKLMFWKKSASRDNATEATAAEKAAAAKAVTDKATADKADADAKLARENARGSAEEISGETELEIPTADGKTEKVTLATLIADRQNSKEIDLTDGEFEIEVAGKKVVVKGTDLVNAYSKTCAAEEETDEEKKKKEKENARLANEAAAKSQAEKDAAASRANARQPSHFKVLLNARNRIAAVDTTSASPDSMEDRLARGNARYGSKKPETAGKN